MFPLADRKWQTTRTLNTKCLCKLVFKTNELKKIYLLCFKKKPRFEEELSKLGATNKTVPTAPTKHKISIQMPTSLPSSSSTGFSSIAAMSAVNSYYAQNNQPPPPPLPKVAPPPPPPSIPHNAQKLPTAPKRDLSGTSKVAPTTAAAAATAVAAADMESKAKKAKIDKDKKKKKIIRCAGGQTWEDDTLADWDPGM